MEEQALEDINARFNEELQQQVEGAQPKGHVYKLGMPLAILQSTGIPDFPIEMTSSKLDEKSQKRGHEFDLSDAVNLPQAIQNPIAIFSYGDKSKAVNAITEIEKNGKKFLVGISINPEVDGKKLEINSVRSIFPKNNSEWLNWIGQDKLLYINKEKIQTLITQQRTTLADVNYLDLDSTTNIVQNFQNPKLPEEKVEKNTVKTTPSEALKRAIDSINTTQTSKKQTTMKRTLTLALLLAAAVCGWAQTHFPKNYNVDLGGGINDAGNYTPVVGVGYTFNSWFALYGRYSFATDKVEDNRLTYWEHTGEVYPSFTVLSHMDRWFVSTFVGIAYKHQRLLGIPTPSRDVTGHNFGAVAGVEGEWHFARFLSAFAGVSYRGLYFKEEPRYEPFASMGVRTSLRVFRKAGYRR